MKTFVYISLLLSQGLVTSVLAGFDDQVPPLPQPNDVSGTVNGCSDAILAHDTNGDGVIRRDEYLSFVNNVADLLCLPPRPILDLELQTVFVSIACLCQQREGNDETCCFGNDAGMFQEGAASVVGRTEDQQSYLRAACLLTQAVLGPEQCVVPTATLGPAAGIPIGMLPPFVPPPSEPNNLLWLLLLLLLLLCCICCCCYRRDKNEEEQYEITVEEQKIIEGPDDPPTDRGIGPMEPDPEQALSSPPEDPLKDGPPAPFPGPPLDNDPEDPPFSAGDEFDEGGDAPRPGPDMPPPMAAGAPGMGEAETDEEDEENIGRKMGANPDDDEEEDGYRKFGGQGMLPNKPPPEGIVLRHIERETQEPGEMEYPEREINEFKYKRTDSGQILDHYVPDGGVYDPQRPPRKPVEMPKPKYERKKKPEPVYIDPRKERTQMGLGDGEVWNALAGWEEQMEKGGGVEKIDWVIHSALTVFAGAEETGDLEKEGSSEEEVSDDEDSA